MQFTPLDAVVRLSWLAAAVAFVIGLSRMNSPAGRALVREPPPPRAGPGHGPSPSRHRRPAALKLRSRPSNPIGWIIILAGVAVGGGYGLYSARTVKMTAMPQLRCSTRWAAARPRSSPSTSTCGTRGPSPASGERRHRPGHHHRLDHVHRLAHRIRPRRACGSRRPARLMIPGGRISPRRPWPWSPSRARSTCSRATTAWP